MATPADTCRRHDGFSEEPRQLFLAALRSGESVLDACALVAVSNRTAYNHRDRDPDFARDWKLAVRMHRAPLELAAFQRGVEGIEEPVFHDGKQIGTRRRYSMRGSRRCSPVRSRANMAAAPASSPTAKG